MEHFLLGVLILWFFLSVVEINNLVKIKIKAATDMLELAASRAIIAQLKAEREEYKNGMMSLGKQLKEHRDFLTDKSN